MFELIEKLRQKSDRSKKQIAFFSSFVFVSFVFGIWLTVIYPDFSFKEKQKQAASVGEASPVSSFFANITEGFSGVKKQIDGIKEAVSSIGTSTHYTTSSDVGIPVISQPVSTTTEDFTTESQVGN